MSIFGGAVVFLYFGSRWFFVGYISGYFLVLSFGGYSGYFLLEYYIFSGYLSGAGYLDTFALDSPLEAAEPQGMENCWSLSRLEW